MNIQLIISSRSPRIVDLSRKRNQLFVALVVAIIMSMLILLGFLSASYLAPLWKGDGVERLRASLIEERRGLEQMSEQMENDINALALSIGKMEARSIRLDALGGRLVMLAGLSGDEFDFTEIPAVGGPSNDIGAVSNQLPDLLGRFTMLHKQIDDRRDKLMLLESILLDKELSKQVLPNGRPVTNGWLSSRYGKRLDPFTGQISWHDGVDFAGKAGSDVVAVASGVVTLADDDNDKYGYGRFVEISHGLGYVTRYAHNEELLVQAGDRVEKGEVIAKMGTTGRSTGPHVHFEVLKNNKTVNPHRYLGVHK